MKSSIGDNIRMLRMLKGLSQENMANELDISVSTYSNLERDVSALTVNRLLLIADILDIRAGTILEMDGKQILAESENKEYSNKSVDLTIEKLQKQVDAMSAELAQLKKPLKKTAGKSKNR